MSIPMGIGAVLFVTICCLPLVVQAIKEKREKAEMQERLFEHFYGQGEEK